MEFEFDKEMDFLLRQTAEGKVVSVAENPKSKIQNPKSVHLDADEISAFAENALPEKTRQNYVLHLADCERCRKNLSGLIALNAETESEIIHAEKPFAAAVTAPEIPWYRKLFAVPNLAYTMGALVLIFAGIAVFTVLQNNSSPDSQISQVSEKQSGGKGMSSDGAATTQEVYSNRMSSNTAAMSNVSPNITMSSSNSAVPSAPLTQANSNAIMARRETDQNIKDAPEDDKKSLSKPGKPNETQDLVSAGALPPPPPKQNGFTLDGEEEKQQPNLSQNSAGQNQVAQNQTQIMPDTRNVQRAPMPAAKMRSQDNKLDEMKKAAKEESTETTGIGGKNFKRSNNIWIDTAYRGQATTNITRGTKEYKKLDSGLRGIVENLGGTVIVVWKEKAYRIQ